jgi:predicted ATPase/Tfp pilus assembly protein PilF
MSPEQIVNSPMDQRSDLFSLGAILYEMFTGKRLFEAPTSLGILIKVNAVEDRLGRPGSLRSLDTLVPGLGELVRGCLRWQPEDRIPSAQVLRARIEDLRGIAEADLRLRDFIEESLSGDITQIFGLDETQDPRQTYRVDDAAPERIDSMTHTRIETPVLRTNVGAERSRIIGREQDLSSLAEVFGAGHRLVTILGPGGSGKTRLAHRYARHMLEEPGARHQVWWCDLRTARDLDGVVQVVSQTLSLTTAKGKTALEQVAHIGAALAKRPAITLILDNFEQIASLAADSIGRWMALSEQTRFLVTSQQRLSINGEACHSLGMLSDHAAIELFCHRAKNIGADLQVLRGDMDALTELVRRLDHLPLAIELAAAHTRIFSPAQILDRLSSRFRLLRGRRPDAPAHHQSLEEALAWSWDLLEPWEQSCLAQLSAFSGGFRMEAVENVVDLRGYPDAPWVIFVVEALVDRSLVQAARSHGGQVRFEMYSAVAEYAEAHLEEGARLEVWRRHAQWYAQYGTLAQVRALRTEGGGERLRLRCIDRANFTAAVDRAIENGWTEDAVLAGQVASLILGSLGPWDAGIAMGDRLLSIPGLTLRQRCRTLLNASWLRFEVDFEGATWNFEEAYRIAQEIGDPSIQAACLSNMAVAYNRSGDLEAAKESLKTSVTLCETHGLDATLATAMINLGNVYERMGHHEDALKSYSDALQQAQKVGDQIAVCLSNINLGDIYRTLGRPDRARDHLDQGLAVASLLKHDRKLLFLLCNHAELDLDEGKVDAAGSRLEKAQVIAERYGEQRLIGLVLRLVAIMHWKRGALDTALQHIDKAEAALTSQANADLLLLLLCNRMEVELASNSVDAARVSMARIEVIQARLGVGSETALYKVLDRLRASIA